MSSIRLWFWCSNQGNESNKPWDQEVNGPFADAEDAKQEAEETLMEEGDAGPPTLDWRKHPEGQELASFPNDPNYQMWVYFRDVAVTVQVEAT